MKVDIITCFFFSSDNQWATNDTIKRSGWIMKKRATSMPQMQTTWLEIRDMSGFMGGGCVCVHIHSRLHIQRIHTPLSMFVGCRLPVVQIQAVLRSRTDKKCSKSRNLELVLHLQNFDFWLWHQTGCLFSRKTNKKKFIYTNRENRNNHNALHAPDQKYVKKNVSA